MLRAPGVGTIARQLGELLQGGDADAPREAAARALESRVHNAPEQLAHSLNRLSPDRSAAVIGRMVGRAGRMSAQQRQALIARLRGARARVGRVAAAQIDAALKQLHDAGSEPVAARGRASQPRRATGPRQPRPPKAAPPTPPTTPRIRIYNTASEHLRIEIELGSQYRRNMVPADLEELRGVAQAMTNEYRAFSRGPYSLALLRRMGHPYGRGVKRVVPAMYGRKRIGRVRGVSGIQPTMTVINKQTGKLARSWRRGVKLTRGGAVVRIENVAQTNDGQSYPWMLYRGTKRMKAHGPFRHVLHRNMPKLNAAWRNAKQAAWRRYQAQQQPLTGGNRG